MSMMGSLTIGREFSLTMMFVWMILASCVESEITKEREECTNQLIALSTCLPYVGGEAKAPTPDCCTGMKQVLVKSKKCLCILVRDRNDPTLGLKINATLALNVPSLCKSSASVADCPALLNLAPNSPAAQVFEQFEKSLHNSTSKSSSGDSSSAAVKGDGGRRRKTWLGMNVAVGLSLFSFTSLVLLMSI